MFDKRNPVYLLLLVSISFFWSCHQSRDDQEPRRAFGDDKFAPPDHLYFQRAYPDRTLDVADLTQAMIQARKHRVTDTKKRSVGLWRQEGPGNAGARINTVVQNPNDPEVIYVGYSSGGIYKTENGGKDWAPIFDDFSFLAIGDIVLDPQDPRVVYAGTGDPNISGNPFIGNGLFKSSDAGATWESIGLSETGIISKIVPHPSDPEVLFVATMGIPYFRDRNRGVYKTENGGQTWQQILFLGEGTGAIDLVMSPADPEVLLASGWDRIRNYEESTTFGNGARIHKTIDGGSTWQMLDQGLPIDVFSRIGLSITAANPDRVYALYVDSTHEVGGVFTSSDFGTSWESIDISTNAGLPSASLGRMGWYFGKIRANPFDEFDVFLLGVRLWRYDAGTKTWGRFDRSNSTPVHADKHDLFFLDDQRMLLATDGGLYQSLDGAQDWTDIEHIPTTQFYHTAYNPHEPDLFYGGSQDNGSLRGNAMNPNAWHMYAGGDGFRTIFHPDDPLTFYVETQRGGLSVTVNGGDDFGNGRRGVNGADNTNWDVPVIMSSHNPDVLYYGTTRVYRNSTGTEVQFEPISDHLIDETVLLDATSNITALAESYFDPNILYAGTGDGNLWRNHDADTIWDRIGAELPDRYITSIHPSQTIEGTVFLSLSGYKSGEDLPHIFVSTDEGDRWLDISGDLGPFPVNDLFVLPNADDQVLFAGTDAGVYFTRDQGKKWMRLGDNMPTITVFDLAYNVAQNRLVAATFGKSIYSFDLEQEGLRGDGTSAIQGGQDYELELFPNPTSQSIEVIIDQPSLRRVDYRVLDPFGKVQQHGYLHASRSINLGHLSPGPYYIQLWFEGRTYFGKIMKL